MGFGEASEDTAAGSGSGSAGGMNKEFDVFYGVDEWMLQQTRGDFVA